MENKPTVYTKTKGGEMNETGRIFHVMLEDKKGTLVGVLYCHTTKKVVRLEGVDPREVCPCCENTFPKRDEIFYVSSMEKLAQAIAKMHEMDSLSVPERLLMGRISSKLEVSNGTGIAA